MKSTQLWHTLEIYEVIKALNTTYKGLTEAEATKRLETYGPNKIEEDRKTSSISLFLGQFKSVLVLILFAAAVVSAFLSVRHSEPLIDTYVILTIILLNAVLGFVQEYRAEKAVEALKKMISPKIIVLREGVQQSLDTKLLVPGDVVLVEAGDRVAADCRIIESFSLEVDESLLTGESIPVIKRATKLPIEATEKTNILYMGTIVSRGRGTAVVTGTGMSTIFGSIADMVQTIEEESPPLKRKIEALGRQLGVISLALCAWVFALGVFVYQTPLEDTLLTSISLAVSAIPEGLPAVLTITLALGMSSMAKQKAIVRRLASVETLGSTTVICSDKTGTITKNEMTVRKLALCDRIIEVTGIGYEPIGEFLENGSKIDTDLDENLRLSLRIGVLCNSSKLSQMSGWTILGDPTDGALLVAGAKAGILKENHLESLVEEFPFESTRKRMSAVYRQEDGNIIAYVKGAPEEIIRDSVLLHDCEGIREIAHENRKSLTTVVNQMAGEAFRVIALAYKILPSSSTPIQVSEVETGLTFTGLAGMIDPPREEVRDAIKVAREAGIRTVMLTGDHRITAVSIARQVGIIEDETTGVIITGEELNDLGERELDDMVDALRVCARVSPEHKLRVAQSLKRKEHIVAMTGDGVNDAPALKVADIGIAMGIKGTDVTREASDIVLEDDNFATIIRAVEGGRRIYANITKYIRLMLCANFDEFLMILVSISLGLPLPFLPIHILWVNLVTDGLPAVALSVDPAEPGSMRRSPRDLREGLLARFWVFIIVASLIAFIADFFPFYLVYSETGNLAKARSAALASIVFFELLLAYQVRSETKHVFHQGIAAILENPVLFFSVVISAVLQLVVMYIKPFRDIFRLSPLSLPQLGLCIVSSFLVFILMPGRLIKRARARK
jgi:Ca2+-transporting ATPase